MSKALVIKNADFSTNKVETVTFNDVPCTGVSFASSYVTLSELGVATVSYTLTPSNTTDEVSFETSDSSVLSVTGNALEVVGIGDCVLTIHCGSYSDQCAVTVDIIEDPAYIVGTIGTQTDSSENEGAIISGSSKRIVMAKEFADTDFTNYIDMTSSPIPSGEFAPIPIPANVQKIHIEANNLYSGNNHMIVFFDDTDIRFIGSNGKYYTVYLEKQILPYTTTSAQGTRINTDVVIPSGAKGYMIGLRQGSTYDTIFNNCTTEADVKAAVEQNFTFSITYLDE